MNSENQPQFRSGDMGFEFDEIHGLISGAPETVGSSFTALLELPSPQAVELLVKEDFPAKHLPPPIFPSDVGLIDRASKFSVFASAGNTADSNTKSISRQLKLEAVKQEPLGSDSRPNSCSPTVSNQSLKSSKRKDRETKVKASSKKSKKVVGKEAAEDGGEKEKLPYVHVRARRGQATDSHSLAERARREKINARMKLLQELVPGCDKISGTAMVLDEIINHVQALQRQVEFLSMRLAAVDPRIDFNLDAVMASEGGLSIDNGYMGMFAPPPIWAEGQTSGTRQLQYPQPQPQPWQCQEMHQPTWGREEDPSHFIIPENSLLSYNSSANSGSMHTNQVKMEH